MVTFQCDGKRKKNLTFLGFKWKNLVFFAKISVSVI